MKRFNAILFVLLFLLSGITFGQYGQSSSEKYVAHVGSSLGKYPQTRAGIQAAINSLKDIVSVDNPGTVFLENGTYVISEPIDLHPNITISGITPMAAATDNYLTGYPIKIKFDFANAHADSSENFIFHIADSAQGYISSYNFTNIYFDFDSIGIVKSYGKVGLIYLKPEKPKNAVDYRIVFSNCYLRTKAKNMITVYATSNDSVPHLAGRIIFNSSQIVLDWGLSVSDWGRIYKGDFIFNASSSAALEMQFYNMGFLIANIYSSKDWEKDKLYLKMNNNLRSSVKVDSCALYDLVLVNNEFRSSTIIMKPFSYLYYRITNCEVTDMKLDIVKSTGTFGTLTITNMNTRWWSWSPGMSINLYSGINLEIVNSSLKQHATTANVGVINIYDGGKASNVQVRNSGIFSRTSSNLAIYAESATTGTNHIYQSVVGDTVSTNFTYSGNTTNSFISFP